MKARVIAVVMSVVLLALPVVLYAQESDPMSTVNAWVEALNAGDIDAALSHLADDAVVQIDPAAPDALPQIVDVYRSKIEPLLADMKRPAEGGFLAMR